MGKHMGLGHHLVFISIFLGATTYTCFGVRNTSVVCSQQERLALLKFKGTVKDESGMLSSWVGNDCGMWERIHCDDVTGNVQSLNLRATVGSSYDDGYYLAGYEVSSCLAELRHLKYLDMSWNDFRGSRIPEFIGSLKQLSYLNLSNVGFQGVIPHQFGNLSNLKVLDLRSNEGLMADDMAWSFGLSSLEHLDLNSVDLGGAQNVDMLLYMIPSLKELSLSNCGLSNVDFGPFLNLSRLLPNIQHLDLGYNSFKGPLPSFLHNMTSLAFVDLSQFDLSLSGNFKNLLSMIPSLSELHLSRCGLDNMHLSSLDLNSSTLSNIQHLDLRENSIEGTFPTVLANMSSLRVLSLAENKLNSSIPLMPNLLELDLSFNQFKQIEHVGIWRQCHLKRLSASFNLFYREITESPKNISECSHYALERLDLRMSLHGTFPEPLGRLENLRSIDLSNNRLIGPIPKSLTRLRFLEVLNLLDNEFTGPIPTFFGNLTKLDLSFNQLNGSIPETFGKLVALTELELQSNRLTGCIPASLGRVVSLRVISLSSNLLNGTIPFSIGQLTKLRFLNVRNNFLEGVLTDATLANLSMLKHLDTSYNTKLTFNISCGWIPSFQLVILRLGSCKIANGFPQWLQNQRKLKILVLSNATISGTLPRWLQKMPIIPFLDLSRNKLSGPLTNLPNGENYYVPRINYEQSLFLEYNIFSDSIPRSLCKMTNLKFLDLSRNRLTGKIPKCLENLQKLVTMIFSSNRLAGVIPGSIALNPSLYRLSLNDNNFVGELPRELGNLRDLSVLDLGDNRFSGNIPKWIGEKLTSLVVLRLHKNNFTGTIPPSLCKTSNLQILDVAHNNLMGTIPRCLGELNAMANKMPVSWYPSDMDFDENVIQAMKGVYLEYGKIWYLVYNMDLSSNKLVGEIPIELTGLSMLVGLNLSNNHLSGGIPNTIGNMAALFSLDLSRNELMGPIPPSIAALNFLSHLNLSHNNLLGRIPTGYQLQTLNDPSIYEGNKDLCGPPLSKSCSNPQDTPMPKKRHGEGDKTTKRWLFYLDIMSGFAIGFWGVIGVMLFKKKWRNMLFMFAEETMDKIYVVVVVRINKMKRGRDAI